MDNSEIVLEKNTESIEKTSKSNYSISEITRKAAKQTNTNMLLLTKQIYKNFNNNPSVGDYFVARVMPKLRMHHDIVTGIETEKDLLFPASIYTISSYK